MCIRHMTFLPILEILPQLLKGSKEIHVLSFATHGQIIGKLIHIIIYIDNKYVSLICAC
jgi:uncharacterized membrane protein